MRLICMLLALCYLLPVQAATSSVFDYDIKHWTSANGLTSNSVRTITQDQQGYLWFGTLYGLHRFDGQQFEIFTTETHPQLASNAITQLLTDKEGRIWVGTKAGLSVFHPQQWQFQRLPLYNEVTSLLELDNGEIWVAADQLFSVSQGQVKRVEHIKAVVSQLTYFRQQLWVAAAEYLYQRTSDGEWLQHALPTELMQTPLYDLSGTDEGLFLASESGLYRLTEQGVRAQSLPDGSVAPVYQVMQDAHGATWISAYRKLFYRFGQEHWQTVTLEELGSSPWFSALYQDQQQHLWLGSFSDGVFRASLAQIRRLLPGHDAVVRSLGLTPQGQLLIAAQTELGILDKAGFYRQLLAEEALQAQTVHDMFWPDGQTLWLAMERGLYQLDEEQARLLPVFPQLQGQTVRAILPDQQGQIWIAALQGLYQVMDGELHFSELNQQLESRQITTLNRNERQQLLGTSRGLYRWQNNRLSRQGSGTALYNAYILAALLLPDDTMLVSTLDDGIFILLPGQNWQQLHGGNGLVHGPAVSFYYHQHSGWIWVSTHKGIFRLQRASLEAARTEGYRLEEILSPFDRQMGSLSSRCCNGAGAAKVVYWQQQLWYPTLKGVVSVPELPAVSALPEPRPHLKSVNAQHFYPVAATQRSVVLEQYERNMQLNFTALEFDRPESLVFRYKLEGFDQDWQVSPLRREAVYTNLPPGNFDFLLQVKYRHQQWQDAAQTQLQLVIPRRFDETLIYRLLWLLLFISTLYGLFWLYRQNALLKQEQLARLVQQRTQELENSNQRLNVLNEQLQQLTHRDSLTGLRNSRFLSEQLPKDIEHFQRNIDSLQQQGKIIALLVLQADGLDQLLATHGKGLADSLLQHFSAVLSRETRGSDYVVRLDDGRFVVVFREILQQQVGPYSRRLLDLLSGSDLALGDGSPLTLSVSGAYAWYPLPLLGGSLLSWEFSLQLASLALRQLQQHGRVARVASLQFASQLDAFEFEETADLEQQVNRLQAEGLIWLKTE